MTTLQVYGKLPANMMGGETSGEALQMDWLSDALKATAHTSTYTPNIDTDEIFSAATNELSTANGYTNGGLTLTTVTISYNATGNITTFGCAAFSWTASGAGLTFRYIVIRDSTVATGPLIAFIDCGAQSIGAGNIFTIDPTASGLHTGTVS